MASGLNPILSLQGTVTASHELVVKAEGSGGSRGSVGSPAAAPLASLLCKVDSSNRLVLRVGV